MKPLPKQCSSLANHTSSERFGDYFTNRSFEFCQSEFKISCSLTSPINVSFIPAKIW